MPQVTRTVTITQDDIDNGIVGTCMHCPAATAIKRAFPEVGWVAITVDQNYTDVIVQCSFANDIVGPRILTDFVKSVDALLPVSAGLSFPLTLDIP